MPTGEEEKQPASNLVRDLLRKGGNSGQSEKGAGPRQCEDVGVGEAPEVVSYGANEVSLEIRE
jgi:hypothetical protein